MALWLIYQAAIDAWKTLLKAVQDPHAREWRWLKKERLRQAAILMEAARREQEARLRTRRGQRPAEAPEVELVILAHRVGKGEWLKLWLESTVRCEHPDIY